MLFPPPKFCSPHAYDAVPPPKVADHQSEVFTEDETTCYVTSSVGGLWMIFVGTVSSFPVITCF